MEDCIISIHGKEGYGVTVTGGTVFDKLKNICAEYPCSVIVTDGNVNELWGEKIRESAGKKTAILVPGTGEQIKSGTSLFALYKGFADAGLDRHGCVIAVGGGTVGDLAGFAAGTYNRGVDFISIPTTLLSMVDSSVGGKTGIDFDGAKNAVGMFYRPKAVIADTCFLTTLPEKEFRNGMGEVLKYSLIRDCGLIELLETGNYDIKDIILKCINIKKEFVEKDEFDRGERMALNLGHTVGHAVEALSGYEFSHGECVAYGLLSVLHGGYIRGLCDKSLFERMKKLTEKYSSVPDSVYPIEEIYNRILKDKKKNGDTVRFVYPHSVGDIRIYETAGDNLLSFLNDMLRSVVFKNTDFKYDIVAPSSKSETIRALICAALCKEKTVIRCTGCLDTDIAAIALRCLGADVNLRPQGTPEMKQSTGYIVYPGVYNPKKDDFVPDFGNCATAARLMYPVAMILNPEFRYTCSPRLTERLSGTLPSYEDIISDETRITADISSQTLSGLLIAKTLKGGNVHVTGDTVSRQYVDLTEFVLRRFGAVVCNDDNNYIVDRTRLYTEEPFIDINCDMSGVAFLMCAAATGSHIITVTGVDICALSVVDNEIIEQLRKMGAEINADCSFITVYPSFLHGIEIDAKDIPDLVPPLCCAAAFAEGKTVFRGVERLKLKESDRIKELRSLLKNLGIKTDYRKGTLTVHGLGRYAKLTAAGPVDTHDHRIAMAAVVLSQNCPDGIELTDPDCIDKSYPGFLDTLKG